MAIRDDTKEQNKAADEAARTARTVTDEAAGRPAPELTCSAAAPRQPEKPCNQA